MASTQSSDPAYNHTWEKVSADVNWASISEDASGNIVDTLSGPASDALSSTTLADKARRRRRRLTLVDHAQSSRRVVRDMIRYLYLLLDLSANMYSKDPELGQGANTTRLEATLALAQDFVAGYFDQNPLSHLGIVVCKGGEAQMLSPLSGSKRTALVALGAVQEGMGRGNMAKEAGQFSLQNGLEVAGLSLGHSPRYGSREVVVVVGALSTCDPGDVLVETLPRLRAAKIRVNCLALTAEMQVCRKIAEETGGIMGVTLDGRHLRDLWMNFTAPPPALLTDDAENSLEHGPKTCEFVPMGFPKRETEEIPFLAYSTSAAGKDNKLYFVRTAYVCPRCLAKVTELPADCAVCALKLVQAPHLARSFHHLFPVPPYEELAEHVELNAHSRKKPKTLEPIRPLSSGSSSPKKVPSSSSTPTKVHSSSSPNKPKSPLPSESPDNTILIPPNLGYHTATSKFCRVDDEIDSSLLVDSTDSDRCCYVCLKFIGVRNRDEVSENARKKRRGGANSKKKGEAADLRYEIVPELLRFQCPDCKNVFCADCDSYLHETLHNCPGCLRQ